MTALGRHDAPVDRRGYLLDVDDNVLATVPFGTIRPMFEAAAGQELAPDKDGNVGKMHAPWSSAMLAANAFGPWLDDLPALRVAGRGGFDTMAFEQPCSTGLGGTAPHPDVVLTGRDGIVAVESKLLEPLSPKTAAFSDAYRGIDDTRRASAWFGLLDEDLSAFRWLDVAQLVKHALGLARVADGAPAHLEYVWWEPTDATSFTVYREHRAELARFGRLVGGDALVSFGACTHADLWASWLADDPPGWLPAHVGRLQSRYARTLTVISAPTPSRRVIDLHAGGTR